MNKILVGSTYFFSCYDGFKSKDIDEVEIIDTNNFKNMRQLSGMGKCLFQVKRQPSKEEYIDYALKNNNGMVIGKFLVPEFCEAIGFTIEDLPRLAPLLKRLNENHKYEEVIYDSYLTNKAFVLTEKQRAKAYELYKNSREQGGK